MQVLLFAKNFKAQAQLFVTDEPSFYIGRKSEIGSRMLFGSIQIYDYFDICFDRVVRTKSCVCIHNTWYIYLDYPNVLCHFNMTPHDAYVSCKSHDTTRLQKTQKTWSYEKFEKIWKNLKKFKKIGKNLKKVELLGLELTTGEVFRSDARCYTIVLQAGKNQSYISCWRYFVLYSVVSYQLDSLHILASYSA